MNMAKDMRALAEQKQKESTCKWWHQFKDVLLNEIEKRANGGDLQLEIYRADKLNEYNFIDSQRLREHAKKELEHMGYDVNFYQGSCPSDVDDKSFVIKW